MKKISFLLTLCCALMACKKNNVDFTYSPQQPRAGQTVTFSNNSTSGEEWEWTFGDGATSTLKTPTHTYKQPGTYTVMLKVDNKNSWTATKQLTVYDTVPTFVASDTLFTVYQDYTFTANVYNPYYYAVEYLWFQPDEGAMIPSYMVITDTVMTRSTLHLYFTRATGTARLGLRVVLNGDTTYVHRTFEVEDRATNSILMRTAEGDFRQRIFGDKAAEPEQLSLPDPVLTEEQDTMQVYNKDTVTLADLASVFPGIQGFHIAKRKIYYRADGLWVANIDGANRVQIDGAACTAMTLDPHDSRIYWANEDGVWYMPYVGSDNNKFVTVPVSLNTIPGVTKLAADD